MTNQINPITLIITSSLVSCVLMFGTYYNEKIPEKVALYETLMKECNTAFPGSEIELQKYLLPSDMKIRCWVGINPAEVRKHKKKKIN